MQAIDRDSVGAWEDAEDMPAAERGAWRSQIWIAVVLGLLLPGLPLAALTLFDWNQSPAIATAPTFPSGAIDPSSRAAPSDSTAALGNEPLPQPSGRTTATRAPENAVSTGVEIDTGPQWHTGFVKDVRRSFLSSWADRRSQPPIMPESGGHR